MIRFLKDFALNTWGLVAEMGPYLLFGFAVAGILSLLIKPATVKRLLGKPGLAGVVKASLVGVPMPLCSCSVIPVAASLRRSGASRGATASFLSSTPQTGVDSILATYALLGGLFTAVRVGVAFITGIVTGFLIDVFAVRKLKADAAAGAAEAPSTPGADGEGDDAACCHSTEASQDTASTDAADSGGGLKGALRYGLITLPADLSAALGIGLVLAGLMTTLLPTGLISGNLSTGPLAFLLATAISLPLYVCATASIPMAYALIAAGLSPGATLVFLIAGPATNTATVATVWKMLGRGATFVYLGSLLVISWTAGALFNAVLQTGLDTVAEHGDHASGPALWQHLAGIVLIAVLLIATWSTRQDSGTSDTGEEAAAPCCSERT